MLTPPPPPPAGIIPLPTPPLPPPPAGVVPISVSESGTPHSVTSPDEQDIVSVGNDGNAEPDRTARRLNWTEVEDLRLVSAWLNSSKSSNSKYWANVVGLYNRNTPKDRKQARVQLKHHWQKINKKVAHFYDCWCKVEAKYSTVWDQPKWKRYISSLYSKKTKLSESGDCTSSSKDSEDAPEIETGEQGSMPVKKKHKAKGKVPSLSSELQEDIQCSADPQNMIEKNHKEMMEESFKMKDKEIVISDMQTDLLMSGTSRVHKLQHGKDGLMADIARFNEFQHGSAVREDVPEKKTQPQGRKTVEHAGTVRGGLPEKETYPQGSKMAKRTMLQKLRLSKEKLEIARLKHQEAKDRKETTLYEKYTELLMADTQRFDEFQKEEHRKAVKRMGEMLFGNDGMELPSGNLRHMY
ncbi:hypothetical protein PAHAL_3G044500 [Panicum hallii]|uniref:Myb-like domain-containing protein n=1 Tax=Panicum hallii TaxID=206008 RepID=A0A2T8KH31_9POAL|nr:hypothetical protein PAHAL_3G044500 [Panicum hallii]